MIGARMAGKAAPSSGAAFAARLVVALTAACALVGIGGLVMVGWQLRSHELQRLATEQRGDVRSFVAASTQSRDSRTALREIGELMHSIAARNGALEVLLVDRRGVVRAASDDQLLGTRRMDSRLAAALRGGRSSVGRRSDVRGNRSDFELVAPVVLHGARYAFEVTFDQTLVDAQTMNVRRTLALLQLVTLVLSGIVFYLVGGRALLASHRRALDRAMRDGLTDLPNDRAFHEDLAVAVACARRHREPLALAMLDLDDFTYLNQRLGRPHGDALLRQTASLLRGLPAGDRVYRVGPDEFAIILPHAHAAAARAMTDRLRSLLGPIRVSCGIAELHAGASDAPLRQQAEAALADARRRRGGATTVFGDVREHVPLITDRKVDAVHRLLDTGDITTVFQPIWRLASGGLVGLEALSRPGHVLALNGPAEAFDIAERIGRLRDLDMLCAELALTRAPVLPAGTRLFLNLSPETLDLDADGADWLLGTVERAGLLPEDVVVEVTERFGGRVPAVVRSLARLRTQGFGIALDDVGTGNSGFEMLRAVVPDYIKLDGGIIRAGTADHTARAVLMAMIAYARDTGAFVIAEGIEDATTLEFVADLEETSPRPFSVIQGGQGYGLGRPEPGCPRMPPGLLCPPALV
jgi:diguanylate cyclase (GGDEF)-like protein